MRVCTLAFLQLLSGCANQSSYSGSSPRLGLQDYAAEYGRKEKACASIQDPGARRACIGETATTTGCSSISNPTIRAACEGSRASTGTAAATRPPSAADPVAPTLELTSTGSGFAIQSQRIITNAHVIAGCKRIDIDDRGQGKVLAVDNSVDLALLEVSVAGPSARLRDGRVRQGERVTVVGYPFAGILSDGPQVTSGNVTALAGLANDTRYTQISAPVQPGNSGGPVLDQSGNVVGVVVSKLGLKFAVATGDLPQNINFAVSLDTVKGFLHSHRIDYQSGAIGRSLETPDLADRARPFTAMLRCYS